MAEGKSTAAELDEAIVQMAVDKNLVPPEKVQEAAQKARGQPISEVLVAEGLLSNDALDQLREEYQQKLAPTVRANTPSMADLPTDVIAALRDKERHLGEASTESGLPRFLLSRQLGSGGFGTVWLAYQPELRRHVAIKVLREETPTEVARLMREARVAAQLRHPNVAPIYDVGVHAGKHYVVMGYIEGQRLDKLRLPPDQAVEIMVQVADGVAAAHRAGIVHRDLKPQNIVLDKDHRPVVLDFGLARGNVGGAITVSGQVVGTPHYMAPEQASGKGKDVTPAVDVYALGATLYHLLCGRPPYDGDTALEILKRIWEGPPPPLREVRPGLPPRLYGIVGRAMARDVEDRYKSADEFKAALQTAFGSGGSIVSPPAGPATLPPVPPPPVAPPPPAPYIASPPAAVTPVPFTLPPTPARTPTTTSAQPGSKTWVVVLVGVGILLLVGLAVGAGLAIRTVLRRSRPGAGRVIEHGTLSVPTSVSSSLGAVGERHRYAFSAAAGRRYTLRTTATVDSEIALIDMNGSTQLQANDDSGGGLASRIDWTCARSGMYYVDVYEHGNDATMPYTLILEDAGAPMAAGPDDFADSLSGARGVAVPSSTPGTIGTESDEDWFSFTAQGGRSYALTVAPGSCDDPVLEVYNAAGVEIASNDDDPTGALGRGARIDPWVASPGGVVYLRVRPFGSRTGTYTLGIADAGSAPPASGASAPSGALVISPGVRTTGRIAQVGLGSYFRFDATAGSRYAIQTELPSGGDSTLTLLDTDGTTRLDYNDDGGSIGYASRIDWTCPRTGTYYIRVGDLNDDALLDFALRLDRGP